ncbi:helix-turn-helix domain-containing protein [Microbulbifer sp. ZKSA004]|uniref:AlbA family DNA-binding domain-containing protein n=1 Tax=Microbulbifer sp. ZKSA004 TaxID=3243389 RepID=UPI00403A4C9B
MSLTQINNLGKPELSERIAQFSNLNENVSGVFRGVYTKTNNQWSILQAVITLDDSTIQPEVKSCQYRYPEYQFICQSISGFTLAELMSSLDENVDMPLSGIPLFGKRESNPNWTENLIPSHAHDGQFPKRRFSARVCSDVHCHDSKLVAHGMPFHMSAFERITEFLGLGKFYGSSDGRKGELCIDIPDRRGRLIMSAQDICFHTNVSDALSVVGAINDEPVALTSPLEKYGFEPEKAMDVELWLVTQTNEILDYCSSTEWEHRYGAESNNTDLEKLLGIISAGESEHCEFKAYIDLVTKKNAKAWDIDKTVCALSNHQGGKLFIGVDDETRIIGINEGCQKHYQGKSDTENAESYQKAIVKRLQESLNKNQCFDTYLIEHNKLFVLVLDVHKANGLNYLLATKEAYIRRGASSPKMTPTEMQAFPVARDVLGRELLAADVGSEWGAY